MRRKREINIYQDNININLKLNQLSLEITKNSRYFVLFFQRGKEDYKKNYLDSRKRISELMSKLGHHISEDPESKVFFRNLNNMLDFHDKLVRKVTNSKTVNPDVYEKITDIKLLYSYMNSHTKNLINSYLDYNSNNFIELLIKSQDRIINIYILIIIISILTFVFALILSNNILTSIDRLTDFAHSLSQKNWDIPDIEGNNFKELNVLGQTFNLMKNNIKEYIEKLKEKSKLEKKLNREKVRNMEKEKLLKESQLMNLQMQMDPHFLFNTLNTVSRMAMFEGANETKKLIMSISKIMRYNLDHKGEMVDFDKEIEVLKAYLTIQQTRFQEQMEFDISVKGKVDKIKIPPMIIQPIVENSIVHGLKDKDSEGNIQINIYKKNSYIEIIIKDNGKGIKKEKLKNIFEKKEKNYKKGNVSLGLYNVKKRLELFYGENLIEIKSEVDKGTEVKIKIPLVMEE